MPFDYDDFDADFYGNRYDEDYDYDDERDFDDGMDGDFDSAMRDAGWGTSEDYGDFGQNEDY
jgi:hypothetical protein